MIAVIADRNIVDRNIVDRNIADRNIVDRNIADRNIADHESQIALSHPIIVRCLCDVVICDVAYRPSEIP